ncbi:hypothetical protein ACFXPY_15505 [Streptomyces sp. NPDC059153]|uniref:hypothetical protein n=1 Tax=Streptomyces sp. NPDC059153 TaxID=3346743 RepID=UPI003675B4FB
MTLILFGFDSICLPDGRAWREEGEAQVKAVIVTKTDRDYVDVVVATKSGPKTTQTTKHRQFYESTKDAWAQSADLQGRPGTPERLRRTHRGARRQGIHRKPHDVRPQHRRPPHVSMCW